MDSAPLDALPLFSGDAGRRTWRSCARCSRARFRSPLAHGAGRYFDGIGSLVLGRPESRYEGQIALEWNVIADPGENGAVRLRASIAAIAVDDRPASDGARRRARSCSPVCRRADDLRPLPQHDRRRRRPTSCARPPRARRAAGRADRRLFPERRGWPRALPRDLASRLHGASAPPRAARRRRHRARTGGRRRGDRAPVDEVGATHMCLGVPGKVDRGRTACSRRSTSGACASRSGSKSSTSRCSRATTSSITSATPFAGFRPGRSARRSPCTRSCSHARGREDDLMAADVRGEIAGSRR